MPSPSTPCRRHGSGRVRPLALLEGPPGRGDTASRRAAPWSSTVTGTAGTSSGSEGRPAPAGRIRLPRRQHRSDHPLPRAVRTTSGERSGRRPSPWRAPGRGFVRPASTSLSNAAEDTWPVLTPREGGPHDASFVSIQLRHPRPCGAPDGKPAGRHLGPGRGRNQFRQPRHAELLEPQPDLQRPGSQPEHAANPGPGARSAGPTGARRRVPAVPGGRARGGPPGRDALPQPGVCRRGRRGRRRRASA